MGNLEENMPVLLLLGVAAAAIVCLAIAAFVLARRIKHTQTRAMQDSVTGGLNGAGFVKAASAFLPRQNGQYAVVAMVLQNLGQVYGTFGMADGARVLSHLYSVLGSALSNAEPAGRISGGTFIFLMKNRQENAILARLERITESANDFNKKLKVPFALELRFGIYLSGGAALVDEQTEKAVQLLAGAEAKRRYVFGKAEEAERAERGRKLALELEGALAAGELAVWMQPKVRLSDSRIAGAEAFARWRHPKRGMLTPAMFVPELEEHHMTCLLDGFVVETVCRRLAQWKQMGNSPCPVSVNLSIESMSMDGFPDGYASVCRRYGVEPGLIEFELSEKLFLEEPEKIRGLIDKIHACGFRCSFDNFGRAAFPMSLLRELDVDTLKLDRGFFHAENNSRRNRFVVEAILKLATQMRIRTVAEGIENLSQVQYLQQAGCDMVQGFYYFRPMSMDEFGKTAFVDGELRCVQPEGGASVPMNTAMHGGDNSDVVMFTFYANEDRAVFSRAFSPALDGKAAFGDAMAFFRHSHLIHENDRKDFFYMLERCSKEAGWVENTLRFYTAQGRYEWLEVHLHMERTVAGGNAVISGTLLNTSVWKNEVKHWKEKANRDPLTGLNNREYFEQHTAALLSGGNLSSGALVFVDVDDFKNINDTLGHMVGDDVLCFVAKRLLGEFRSIDVVGRYAGDEFVVFVNGGSRKELEKRLEHLCEVFRTPYRSGAIEYPLSVSVGAAMFPEDGINYHTLLEHADSALYKAKEHGKNIFVFYQPGM